MDGEEDGSDAKGRGFAHVVETGISYDLPSLGRFAYENALAHPNTGDATVVVGTDDSTPGQVYVYAGQKRTEGTPVQKAGLVGGALYGIKVAGGLDEMNNPEFPLSSTFSLVPLAGANLTVSQLQAASEAAGVTEFWRPEDGHWDTTNPNVFWFATTANFDGPTRLWKATFVDAAQPELGGTIEAALAGTEGLHMLDNLTVADKGGQLLLQEDPGNQEYLARVYSYNTRTDRVTPILEHDPARFSTGGSQFLTTDEESSGVIDVSSLLGEGSYLLTTQVHRASDDAELVELGQLQLVRVAWKDNGKG
jgi:secreted PhoX family phosphatase